MASHIFILFDGQPGSAAFISGAVFYGAGLTFKYPLLVRVTRSAAGKASIVKIQGAALPVNNCAFATRGPGGEQGELQVVAMSGDFYQVLLRQQVGPALPMTHDFLGGLLTLNLGTDDGGNPAGTVENAATYINDNLAPSDFVATWTGSAAGRLGSTLIPRPCARAHWMDVVSTEGGLLPATVEHTFDPGLGATADYGLEINVRNYYAIRAMVSATGESPAEGDRAQIYLTEEGA